MIRLRNADGAKLSAFFQHLICLLIRRKASEAFNS